MKKILVMAAITTVGLFVGNASAASITYDFSTTPTAAYGAGYTAASANWTAVLSLPKFNLPGQTLDSAVLTYGGDFMSTGAIDNEDASANPAVSVTSQVQINFFGDGTNSSSNIGLNYSLALSSILFGGALGADSDGTADFIGSDAETGLVAGANNNNVLNIANLAAVQGADNFMVYLASTKALSFTGAINLASNLITRSKGQMSIVYNYHNPSQSGPANNVPEPGTLALMMMGVAGLCVLRKRKYSAFEFSGKNAQSGNSFC